MGWDGIHMSKEFNFPKITFYPDVKHLYFVPGPDNANAVQKGKVAHLQFSLLCQIQRT